MVYMQYTFTNINIPALALVGDGCPAPPKPPKEDSPTGGGNDDPGKGAPIMLYADGIPVICAYEAAAAEANGESAKEYPTS